MTDTLTVDVIYIVFAPYGEAPVESFLAAHDGRPAGHDHRLVFALKGFADDESRAAAIATARRVGARAVEVPSGGFDIGTYLDVAARSDADVLCLMNSHSEPLVDGWLGKLTAALREQGGGAVAATGSWESHASDQLRALPGHPARLGHRLRQMMRLVRHYPIFPNIHLRTNAMAIARADLLRFAERAPETKEQAWRFESGRSGLSATLQRARRPIRVVGRDGRAFAPAEWDRSGTFWQGNQDNLMVADNQTRRFAQGSSALRANLHALAWQAPRPERAGRAERWHAL